MTRKELFANFDIDDNVIFLEPADLYDKGIIGISHDSQHIIYDYDRLVMAFSKKGIAEEDAREWLDYNTLGSLPLNEPYSPIVIFS